MTEAIVAVGIGILLGVGLVMLYLAYRIKLVMNALDTHLNEALEQVAGALIKIVVEKDNGTYYCYRKEDHQFVCQGSDIKSLLEAFKTAYPDKVAVIADTTDAEIIKEFKKIAAND